MGMAVTRMTNVRQVTAKKKIETSPVSSKTKKNNPMGASVIQNEISEIAVVRIFNVRQVIAKNRIKISYARRKSKVAHASIVS